MIDDALASIREVLSPPFRTVLYKSLALTLAILAVFWALLERAAAAIVAGGTAWLKALIEITAAFGLFIGLIFLIAPVSMLVAGFFLDELAEHVEADIYPDGPRGSPAPLMDSLWLAVKFSLVALVVNFCAFCVWLLPGVNALVFVLANAYLFSREYFELAASRYRPIAEVRELRRRHRLTLFMAGLIIAVFVATPVLNLLTPLFGVALLARLHKRLSPPAGAQAALAGAR